MGSMPLTQLWQRHVSQTSIVREGHQKALGPGTCLGQDWRSPPAPVSTCSLSAHLKPWPLSWGSLLSGPWTTGWAVSVFAVSSLAVPVAEFQACLVRNKTCK